jgi:hypothetical protein
MRYQRRYLVMGQTRGGREWVRLAAFFQLAVTRLALFEENDSCGGGNDSSESSAYAAHHSTNVHADGWRQKLAKGFNVKVQTWKLHWKL